ncbi:MAG: hypothetical protein JO212_09860, partial [Acetobacteraceae bacterium]|nr:hypothetical protein [Acetobacteraceae bacterium]
CVIRRNPLQIGLFILLGIAITACFYRNQVLIPRQLQDASAGQFWYGRPPGQFWYGRLFAALQASGNVDRVIVLDRGMQTLSGEKYYNPMLKLYAQLAREYGLTVTVTNSLAPIPAGQLVATCDPDWVPVLEHQDRFKVVGKIPLCVWGLKAAGERETEAIRGQTKIGQQQGHGTGLLQASEP